MTMREQVQLTIEVDKALRCRLEDVARRKDVSLSDYCAEAIERMVANDEPKALTHEETAAWLDGLDELRNEIFGDRVLPDSVPLIRKMRGHDD